MDNSLYGGTPLDPGVNVQTGNKLVINADGCWTNGPETPPYGPDGIAPSSFNEFYVGTLIARIGDGGWFEVGSPYKGKVTSSGRLYFCFNDTNSFDNSRGEPTVRPYIRPKARKAGGRSCGR